MDLSPSNVDDYTLVTKDEFELFINQLAPNNHRTAHMGGENYRECIGGQLNGRKIYGNRIIATHIIASGYYVHNDFIKN